MRFQELQAREVVKAARENLETLYGIPYRLPEIELGGVHYTVDIRLRELRETARPWMKLSLDELDSLSDQELERLSVILAREVERIQSLRAL